MKLILTLYDFLSRHNRILWSSLIIFTMSLVGLITHLHFSEDISDFLPLGNSDREAMSVYQNISGANRLYILFTNPDDPDLTVEAIDYFLSDIHKRDTMGMCHDLTAQFNISQMEELMDFVYTNIPYFLTPDDYQRMDSLLAMPNYVTRQLEYDKEALLFPSNHMVTTSVTRDPLGLFTPVIQQLRQSHQTTRFEMYDGYIFTPDMSRAIAMMQSPFGNSETEMNSQLLELLQASVQKMVEHYPTVQAHILGGPEIAVGNASRIKSDSILAISLSVILILLLLIYAFRSLCNILLIFLSIGWGWLFAMGGMYLFSDHVSIIVIGISSVILGIAVNYPLHLIAHTQHQPDMRITLREIVIPLVVGNVTTVGAFLALVPLQSTALRDLGIFASLLLVGTILFVLLFLPHLVHVCPAARSRARLLHGMAAICPDRHRPLMILLAALTVGLFYFSFHTQFDPNVANINYMSRMQRQDMDYFQHLMAIDTTHTTQSLYVLSSGPDYDQALAISRDRQSTIDSLTREGLIQSHRGALPLLSSKSDQTQRLVTWNDFVSRHHDTFTRQLSDESEALGFSAEAFSGFQDLVTEAPNFTPQSIDYFAPLTQLLLSQHVTHLDSPNRSYIIDVLEVQSDRLDEVKSHFDNCFDIASMNSALTNNLSDNFNYIGWACSIIVFFFLWFSFGRIELAFISFLPMAISWIWILGIMAIWGIKFNIVNIILATFIFGQGDDYTIFMTEGCQHEYTYRRPILASYKSSIIQSALIMFVGIGTLIVAQHPAMRSLAQVTIVGMFSVVLMAYTIPPFCFRWLTTSSGVTRRHPITLRTLLTGQPTDPVALVRGRYIYKGLSISRSVNRHLRDHADELYNIQIEKNFTIHDSGYGEQALLLALLHPDAHIVAILPDVDRLRIAQVAAQDFVTNIQFKTLVQ